MKPKIGQNFIKNTGSGVTGKKNNDAIIIKDVITLQIFSSHFVRSHIGT